MNVLINAYAVSPSWGSEPGMGWNWIVNIAKHCKVHVITEGEWREDIEKALETLPQRDNISFHYIPVSEKVRAMCWNQGDWRFYRHYAKWQRKALKLAREIIKEHDIDVIHQLNMIGFREPGYLYKIKEKPIVWGPVGGMVEIPVAFLNGAGWKMNLFIRLKNILSNLQLHFHPRVRAMVNRSTMIAATSDTVRAVKKVYGRNIPLINETGVSDRETVDKKDHEPNRLNLLWVGKFDFRKRLDIALKTIAQTATPNVHLTVAGTGSEDEVAKYKSLAEQLGIAHQVTWAGKVPHDRISQLMLSSDLLFFTSISEATSTVVLEAIECGLPVLSLNACGFGPLVKEFAGVAVEATNPEGVIKEFAQTINTFASNPNRLRHFSQQELENKPRHKWSQKGLDITEIYRHVINSQHIDRQDGGGEFVTIYSSNRMRVLWVGKFDFRKQLKLACQAISSTANEDVAMYVCGGGTNDNIAHAREMAISVGAGDRISFLGNVPHASMAKIMRNSEVLLFTSVSEGTPHVVLEAMQEHLPVICLDTCGQGDVVTDSWGAKIPLSSPEYAMGKIATVLDDLASHREKIKSLASACSDAVKSNLWQSKVNEVLDIYNSTIEKHSN